MYVRMYVCSHVQSICLKFLLLRTVNVNIAKVCRDIGLLSPYEKERPV